MKIFEIPHAYVSLIAINGTDGLLGTMACTKVRIEERVLMSTNKGWDNNVNIVTMGHKPVNITLTGIHNLFDCKENGSGSVMAWYKQGNVHDNPLVRFKLTVSAKKNESTVTYTCVWIGLNQLKTTEQQNININGVTYDATFVGVRSCHLIFYTVL